MTYLIKNNYTDYLSLVLDTSDLSEKMPSYSQRFRAKPRLDEWVAPQASFYASDNASNSESEVPDITTWALGNLVLNNKAYLALKDLLIESGEFLPLIIEGETYQMFNTLFVAPEEAVDTTSSIEVIDSGVHMGTDNVKFNENILEDHCVFKSMTNKLTYSFATNKFKEAYERNCLTGLVFE